MNYHMFPAVAIKGGLAGAEAAAALGEGGTGTVIILGGYPTYACRFSK